MSYPTSYPFWLEWKIGGEWTNSGNGKYIGAKTLEELKEVSRRLPGGAKGEWGNDFRAVRPDGVVVDAWAVGTPARKAR